MMARLLLAACACLGVACGGEGGGPAEPDAPEVATVELTPVADTLSAGDSVELTAKPRSASEEWLQDRVVSWSSSNPAVATVTDAGLVHALDQGTTTILATADGVSSAASIAVVVGVTGTWAGNIDADGTVCPLTLSLTESLGASISGSGFVDLPCIAQAFPVVGLNHVGGVPDRVHLVFSLEDGDLAIDGDFDGVDRIFAYILQGGCTGTMCSWDVSRTSIHPTPIATSVGALPPPGTVSQGASPSVPLTALW